METEGNCRSFFFFSFFPTRSYEVGSSLRLHHYIQSLSTFIQFPSFLIGSFLFLSLFSPFAVFLPYQLFLSSLPSSLHPLPFFIPFLPYPLLLLLSSILILSFLISSSLCSLPFLPSSTSILPFIHYVPVPPSLHPLPEQSILFSSTQSIPPFIHYPFISPHPSQRQIHPSTHLLQTCRQTKGWSYISKCL